MANAGRKLGLIRAADTRMAGYFIAMHRMLRCRNALRATVASIEFTELNLKHEFVKRAVKAILDETMWSALFVFLIK